MERKTMERKTMEKDNDFTDFTAVHYQDAEPVTLVFDKDDASREDAGRQADAGLIRLVQKMHKEERKSLGTLRMSILVTVLMYGALMMYAIWSEGSRYVEMRKSVSSLEHRVYELELAAQAGK